MLYIPCIIDVSIVSFTISRCHYIDATLVAVEVQSKRDNYIKTIFIGYIQNRYEAIWFCNGSYNHDRIG